MRGWCVSILAGCLAVGLLNAGTSRAADDQELKFPKAETWELTLRDAPKGWQRDSKLILPVLRKLEAYFPDKRTELLQTALSIAQSQPVADDDRFEVIKFAMRRDPPPDIRRDLKIQLARLQASYNAASLALETVADIENPDKIVVIRKSRSSDEQSLADLIHYWKLQVVDILATGRNYEAERLLEEAREQVDRENYRQAADRLIKVAMHHPNGYLPQEDGAIVSTGAYARDRLAELAVKNATAVSQAADEASPGLLRRAREGERNALVLLATIYPFTEAGAEALRELGERDLDAGRPALAALRLQRLLQQGGDASAQAEGLWRLALARGSAGEMARADAALAQLVAVKDASVRMGDRKLTPAQAADAVRAMIGPPASPASPDPSFAPGTKLRPRFVFTYRPALFDLNNRQQNWPRFWDRPESLAAIDGDRAYFHDSRSVWAIDWRAGKVLWRYCQPGYINELAHRGRSFSNQINEAYQTSRGYRVGVSGRYIAARFRQPTRYLVFDLCGWRAEDGALAWTSDQSEELAGLSFAGDPVGAYDRFYVLAYDTVHISTAWVVCLEPADGKVLWKVPVASGIDSFKSSISNFFGAHGGLTVRDGRIYLNTDRGSFVALDAMDGSLLWVSGTDRIFERHSYWGFTGRTTNADLGSLIERNHTAPVVGPDGVYLLCRDHPGLFAFTLDRGKRTFVDLPRVPVEMLGVHDGRIIAAGRNGLYALDTSTGEVAWQADAPPPPNWRSGVLSGGRIYWPDGSGLRVISATDGGTLGRVEIEGGDLISSVRFLPGGELVAFGSRAGVDRFMVLSADAKQTVHLTEETPGMLIDGETMAARDPAALAAPPTSPAARPAPLPPLRLLWRARFSPEELFNGRYPLEFADNPTRLLVAAGGELACYRFDEQGALLWRAGVPSGPQDIQVWSGDRVYLRWEHGFEVYELPTGKWLWGWNSSDERGRDNLTGEVWGAADDLGDGVGAVWGRAVIYGISVPQCKELWSYRVFNNAYQVTGNVAAGGLLMYLRQDPDYGGRSWAVLFNRKDGKIIWKQEMAPNTTGWVRGDLVWTASRDRRKLALFRATPTECKQLWQRDLGRDGDSIVFEEDRILVGQGQQTVVLDRMTGKDEFAPIRNAGGLLVGGPSGYAARIRSARYGYMDTVLWDYGKGQKLWTRTSPGGNHARPLAAQVAVPLGMDRRGGGYWWTHVIRAYLGSIYSLDPVDGRALGRWQIPGRNVWDADDNRGHLAIMERDNLLLIKSEQGPVVLGATSLLTRDEAAKRLAKVATPARTAPQHRELVAAREALMRYDAPILGCDRLVSPPVLDGEFDDWTDARWTAIDSAADWIAADGGSMALNRKAWGGVNDCSARFAVRHDGQVLYLAVEVRDDDFCPPTASGQLTPGDGLEIGISRTADGVDALESDHDRLMPDLKVLLSLVGGHAVARPIYNGQDSDVAVSVRPGIVRYEAAIPFSLGRYRLLDNDRMGLALRVNDSDGGRPKGAMRWAGGLGHVNASSQFGALMMAPLAPDEIVERRRVARLLPTAALSWELLRDVLHSELAMGDAMAALEELHGFLSAHPDSYHASRVLAWNEYLLALGGDGKSAEKTRSLAERLKVPQAEQDEARMRVFARVRVAGDRRPTGIGLRFGLRSHRWNTREVRGIYWGQNRGPIDAGMFYAGPLPDGEQLELNAPAEFLELANRVGMDVTFLQRDGEVWWGDMGLIDASGKRSVWVPAGADCKERNANWLATKDLSGQPAHRPDVLKTSWSEHSFSPLKLAGNVTSEKAAELHASGGTLPRDECLKAARLIPDNALALSLLEAVGDAEEVARFVRDFPAGRQTPAMLYLLARMSQGDLANTLIDEGNIPRASARAYYAKVAAGIEPWLAVGPFSNEGDVALRRIYPPENDPDPAATYPAGGEELHWQKAQAGSDGFVNFGTLFDTDDYQAAYAMTWVFSNQRQRAWVYVESPNVVSLWCGNDRLIENSEAEGDARSRSRSRQAEPADPVPITLESGWNRLLVKVAGRWGYWGVKVRLGTAQGRPLTDLKFSAPPPGVKLKPADDASD